MKEMKNMKNMKKWFIALAALALLLIPSVTVARAGQGEAVRKNCRECNQVTPGYVYSIDDSSETSHQFTFRCGNCGGRTQIIEPHSGGGATCARAGKCDICDRSYYTDHSWGAWTKADENQHVSTCQNSGCNQTQSGEHSGNATCTREGKCAICFSLYKDSTNHVGPYTYSYESSASSENQHTVTETCTGCGKAGRIYDEEHQLEPHDGKAPTCTEVGWEAYEACTSCTYTTYREIPALGHDYASKTTPATCTAEGYTTYTCAICSDSYRGKKVPALGHWYAEWTSNGSAAHTAPCKRDCDKIGSADCTAVACAVLTGEVRTEFILCPVCGEIRQAVAIGEERIPLNDAYLLLVEDAAAEALTERLPAGEVVVRTGALESGEVLMSVAFEISGKMTQPTGQVKISLPAEALNGCAIHLIDEDGTETPIDCVIEEETASFTLDFTEAQTPSRLLRLVPQA